MGIQIISISHKIAPLHVREMFAFTKEQQEEMMRRMTDCLEVSECVVLSTCNRTEMYVYSESGSEGVVFNRMEDVLLECAGAQEEEDIGNYLLFFHGKKAIQHLFEVAAGLDSMGKMEKAQAEVIYRHLMIVTKLPLERTRANLRLEQQMHNHQSQTPTRKETAEQAGPRERQGRSIKSQFR